MKTAAVSDEAPVAAPSPLRRVTAWTVKDGPRQMTQDVLAEEVPVALVYNGVSHAVMLATPQDLEDLALGFSFTEGIIRDARELYDCELVEQAGGIEARLEISTERFALLKERRRTLAGRTGCGLCGIESLGAALCLPAVVSTRPHIRRAALKRAMQALREGQRLHRQCGATHAAGWVTLEGEVLHVREDVGRHNALDKLIGVLLAQATDMRGGFLAVTSRASYEMVQKSAAAGAGLLAAVSAPTALAVDVARQCGLALVGWAREDSATLYSYPETMTD